MKTPLAVKALIPLCWLLGGSVAWGQTTAGGGRANGPGSPVPPGEAQEAAVAAIKKLGGEVRFNRDKSVDSVGLDHTAVTDADLVHLKDLVTANTIALRFTKVTGAGFAHFKELTNLKSLYLPGSTVGDAGLEQLKNLPSLVNLYLQETKITDAGLDHLKGLSNLRILYLAETTVSDPGLAHLKGLKLTGLYLGGTAVTDAGLGHLTELRSLKDLDLVRTKVTANGVKGLQQALPNCVIKANATTHEGVWKPIAAVLSGMAVPPPQLEAITLKITGGNYEVTVAGENATDKGTCTLDTSAIPNRMTIQGTEGPNKGKTILAIFEMKDSVSMRVCYDLSGKDFPKEFKAPKGTQHYLVGYRRRQP